MSQVIRAEELQPVPFLLRPPFPPSMEAAFQRHYYLEVGHTLRYASLLLSALFMAYALRDYLDTHSVPHLLRQNGAPAFLFLAIFGLTFWKGFGRIWQETVLVGGVAAGLISLDGMGAVLGPYPIVWMGPFAAQHLFFGFQTVILMVAVAVLRVQFRFALLLELGILAASLLTFSHHLAAQSDHAADAVARLVQPILVFVVLTVLVAYVQEKLSRQAFHATYLLDQERSAEHRKRLETEGKLQVLGQSVGGIVHDLGNPLTQVQLGVSTLQTFLESPEPNRELLADFAESIHHGAEMLNCLRLSLMEQTRVLEGEPSPVELRHTRLRAIIQASVQFQKPNHTFDRTIRIPETDIAAYADAMKLTTVFMNLIGNALKYSDGEVQVRWREDGPRVLVAVSDQGTRGRGISQEDAQKLFVPFGRLEAHTSVEGTGLGLLSVRNVIQAHGGEVYIEGHVDGTGQSPVYATAEGDYPRMLSPTERSAFVVVLISGRTGQTAAQD